MRGIDRGGGEQGAGLGPGRLRRPLRVDVDVDRGRPRGRGTDREADHAGQGLKLVPAALEQLGELVPRNRRAP